MTASTIRRSAAALIAAALAATAAGCGGSDTASSSSGDAKTITVQTVFTASAPEGAPFKAAVEKFQQQTGITVKVVESDNDALFTSYESARAAGREPDIAIVNLKGKSLNWLNNGAAVPVTDYLRQWNLTDRIQPDAVKEWTDDQGRLRAFPYVGFSWPVWYNTALLKSAGITTPPKTPADLLTAAKALRAKGVQPFAVGGSDWSGQKLLLQIAQTYTPAAEAQQVFAKGTYCSSPGFMKGLQLFTQLRDGGVFVDQVQGLTADNMHASFYSGKVAMMSAGSWAFADTPAKERSDVVLGGFPVPADGVYTEPTALRGFTAVGLWVSPNGQKKLDAVRQFVQAMYQPAVVDDFVAKANLVPAATPTGDSAPTNPLLADATGGTLAKRVNFAVMPDLYLPSTIEQSFIRATSTAYAPGTSAQQICSALQKTYR